MRIRSNDRAGHSRRAAPEYAFRMESRPPPDWERFLITSPRGCFVMEDSNNVVGTAATICYENRFAWIGMVLVDPEYRKQELELTPEQNNRASRSLKHFHNQARCYSTRKPLYTKLGFISEFEIERWTLKRPATIPTIRRHYQQPLTECQESELFRLDRELFGADRSFLLRSLCKQAPELAMTIWQDGMPHLLPSDVTAYLPTTRTMHGDQPAALDQLLRGFLARSSRETLIVDCIKSNPGAVESLAALGFAFSRPLTRMVRVRTPTRPARFLWAILGPEFG